MAVHSEPELSNVHKEFQRFFLECIIVHYFYLNFTCYHSAHVKASLKFSSIDNVLVFLLTSLIYYYPIFQIINTDRKKLFESLMVLPQKIFSTTNLKSRDVKTPKHLIE